jgi:opacity protein-like surface antigen
MFRFWGAKAALAKLIVTSAILAVTVGNINAQEAFKPYSVELLPSGQSGGLENCADAAGCGPGAGKADPERVAKFKKHFKKKADKTAKVCDVIVYGEAAGGGSPSHFVIAVTECDNPLTIGQNGNPPEKPPTGGTKLGNVTINSVGTWQNSNNKEPAKDWDVYTPIDEKSADAIVKEHKDAIDKAQKDAAGAVQDKDGKMPEETKKKWLELWRLCRNRNIALMGPDASGAGPRQEKYGFRPPALQPLGPTPSPLRPPEGYYAGVFFFGVEGVANFNSLGMLEKDATNGVATNGFGESSRAGGGGFLVGANTRIFSRMVLPDDASPRPVERVLLSFDFFNQDTSHVFPTTPQTFIGATSKFMVTGEVQLGVNVVPGVQIYGIGGFSVLNQDLNINFGGGLVTTQNNTTIGPTYGAGLSFQIPGSPVTSFVQWEQTPFATTTLPRPPASSNFNYDFTNTSNRVKAGILVNLGGFSS